MVQGWQPKSRPQQTQPAPCPAHAPPPATPRPLPASTHNAGSTLYPFPRDLFAKIVTEHGGYFPVKIQALREGTPVHAHVPVYQARGV
jgi:hypothetical protein